MTPPAAPRARAYGLVRGVAIRRAVVEWRYDAKTNTHRDGPLSVRALVPRRMAPGRYLGRKLWGETMRRLGLWR